MDYNRNMTKESQRNGVYACYYYDDFDGQKKKQRSYKEGKRDGKSYSWYENGQIKEESNYKEGKQDGKSYLWYENGQIKEESNFINQNQVVTHTEWYENGQKRRELQYKNGVRDGVWTLWHDNGQKDDESIYKDGDEVDRSLWDRNGKKRKEEKEIAWGGSSYGDDPFEELGLTDDDRSLGRAFWKNIL